MSEEIIACSTCHGSGFNLEGKECACGAAGRRMREWFKDARNPAEAERAAIVAWLQKVRALCIRSGNDCEADGDLDTAITYDDRAEVLYQAITAIERGDHQPNHQGEDR